MYQGNPVYRDIFYLFQHCSSEMIHCNDIHHKKFGGVSKSMLLKSVNKKIENIETKFTVFSKFYNIDV